MRFKPLIQRRPGGEARSVMIEVSLSRVSRDITPRQVVLTSVESSGTLCRRKNISNGQGVISMIWLQFAGIALLITVGIFLIAFLEEKVISGPRRRQLQERAREKLAGSSRGDQ